MLRIETDIIAKVLTAPVLVLQGMYVRRKALILPEASGARSGQIGEGEPLDLIVIGDSSAAGVGVDSQKEALSGQLSAQLGLRYTVRWHLVAKTGDTTQMAIERLEKEPAGKFDIAVVCLGVNDVTSGVGLRRWIAQQKRLHDMVERKFGVSQTYISGLPPMKYFPLLPNPLRWVLGQQAERFDRGLKAYLSKSKRRTYIPLVFPHDVNLMAADGYHPSAAVYKEWAGWISSRIFGQSKL